MTLPVMWLHRPGRVTFALHSTLVLPLMLAVSILPGLAIPNAAMALGVALTVLTLWCVWVRPEDGLVAD